MEALGFLLAVVASFLLRFEFVIPKDIYRTSKLHASCFRG